jgi:hypothetical protein
VQNVRHGPTAERPPIKFMKIKQLQRKINQEKFDVKGLEVVLEVEGLEVTLVDVVLDKENKVVRLQGGAEVQPKK